MPGRKGLLPEKLGGSPFLARPGPGEEGPRLCFATTGPDGRFRIEGLPRDGIATASITGPGIETSEVYILTRDMPTIRVKDPMIADGPMIVYYGARFDHVAASDAADRRHRPRQGHRRPDRRGPHHRHAQHPQQHDPDARRRGDHGRPGPVPGQRPVHLARVQALHRGPGRPALCELRVRLPGGRAQARPFTFDIALKRGVLVRGRLTNKATGKPVRRVTWNTTPFADNPHLDEFPNFKRESQVTRFSSRTRRPVHDPGPAGPRPDRRPGARGGLPPRSGRRRHQGLRQADGRPSRPTRFIATPSTSTSSPRSTPRRERRR